MLAGSSRYAGGIPVEAVRRLDVRGTPMPLSGNQLTFFDFCLILLSARTGGFQCEQSQQLLIP
jgi:hypothetical protein